MIKKQFLEKEYIKNSKSSSEIAKQLSCSENKVNYWLNKHGIKKRSIAAAVYLKNNPNGDPFSFKKPSSNEDWFLFGLGIGLFWGEGNKQNKTALRLGNTDPELIKLFLTFLNRFYQIDNNRLRFGLQIFSDMNSEKARSFWMKKIGAKKHQFQKIVVTKSFKNGTYKNKTKHGVLTIYFSNTKLRDSIVGAVDALQKKSYANVAQSVERIHGKSQ